MLLAKQSRYWNAGGNAINVETAGYALLAQLQLGRTGYAGPIVTYITSQRKGGAGFVSTQVGNVRILNTRHDFGYKKGNLKSPCQVPLLTVPPLPPRASLTISRSRKRVREDLGNEVVGYTVTSVNSNTAAKRTAHEHKI